MAKLPSHYLTKPFLDAKERDVQLGYAGALLKVSRAAGQALLDSQEHLESLIAENVAAMKAGGHVVTLEQGGQSVLEAFATSFRKELDRLSKEGF